MILLEDTRNQIEKHKAKNKWFEENGIKVRRTKLYVGDYTLPTNQSICVDTKENILEIISDVCGKQHARFIREIERAEEINAMLYVLIENNDGVKELRDLFKWQNPRTHRYNKIRYMHERGMWLNTPLPKSAPTSGQTIAKALLTIESKHPNVKFLFCKPSDAGRRVIELLEGETDNGNSKDSIN